MQSWPSPLPCMLNTGVSSELFSKGVAPATLKVYVGVISAEHASMGGVSVGCHPLFWKLKLYVDRIAQWRGSDQLFVCLVVKTSDCHHQTENVSLDSGGYLYGLRGVWFDFAYRGAWLIQQEQCLLLRLSLRGLRWKIFVLRQDGPLLALSSSSTVWM